VAEQRGAAPGHPELHLFAKIYKDLFALQRRESR
jgi:hypothetical protein